MLALTRSYLGDCGSRYTVVWVISSCVPDASHVRKRCHPEIHQSQMDLPYDTATLHFPRSFVSFIIPPIFHVIRVHRV